MTHSLHRAGSEESLSHDFVAVTMAARGISDSGCSRALRDFLSIARQCGAVNYGDMKLGSRFTIPPETLEESVKDSSIVQAVFADIESLETFVAKLIDAKFGLSVTVSGLLEPLALMASRLGLTQAPHTIAYSLGVWGKLDLLSPHRVLGITTMCGHGLVGARLVEQVAADLRAGLCTVDQAAEKLAKPCVCGIFNPKRAVVLLNEMTADHNSTGGPALSGCP